MEVEAVLSPSGHDQSTKYLDFTCLQLIAQRVGAWCELKELIIHLSLQTRGEKEDAASSHHVTSEIIQFARMDSLRTFISGA